MPFCPNPSCPGMRRTGAAPEYRAGIAACADCGTSLVDHAPAALPVGALGVPRAVALPMPGRVIAAIAWTIVPLAGLVLAAIQGWNVVAALMANARGGLGDIAFAELGDSGADRVIIVVTLVAGACLLRALAWVIERRGVLNGIAALAGFGALSGLVTSAIKIARLAAHGAVTPLELVLMFVGVGAVVAATLFCVRPRDDGDPHAFARPIAGIVPTVIGVPVASSFFIALTATNIAMFSSSTSIAAEIALSLALVPLFAYVFGRPARAIALWSKHGVASDDEARASFRAALAASVALNVAILTVRLLSPVFAGVLIDALFLVSLIAVARDFVVEVQARRSHDLVVVWPFHRFDLMADGLERLRAAGITTAVRGAHYRALYHFFAPLVPAELLVPAGDVDRARAILAEER